MLTIICGENIVKSREYLLQAKEQAKLKGYEIRELRVTDIDQLEKWLFKAPSLFAERVLYITENLVKHLKGKRSKHEYSHIDDLGARQDIYWYDWEKDLSAREITGLKKVIIKEFKLSESIFKLLDQCYPGNKKFFFSTLQTLSETNDEMFIYTLLHRHIRTLLVLKSGDVPKTLPPWQKAKLLGQAEQWTEAKLATFYEGLARIDLTTKTSSNIFGIKGSIEVLASRIL